MDSPFVNIFMALQQRIQAQAPAITYIDQDLGQLRQAVRPPVSWPCVLIDFEDFAFENMGEHVQTATGTVVVRLGFAPHSNSGQATPSSYIQQALGYYDLEWTLHKALQGWAPGDDYGCLIRTSTATQQRSDSYRVREIRYSITFEDYSTQLQREYVSVPVVITP